MRRFIVEGEPHPKGRPRAALRGGHPIIYTPKSTAAYEELVRSAYLQQVKDKPYPKGVPVSMILECVFAVPANTSQKRLIQLVDGEERPTKRPDADNILKAVADALNGVAYHDDAQIAEVVIRKLWGRKGMLIVELDEIL